MSYYKNIQKANEFIDEVMEKVKNGLEVDINLLMMELTKMFAVSEKVFTRRIELNKTIDKNIKQKENILFYSEIDEVEE